MLMHLLIHLHPLTPLHLPVDPIFPGASDVDRSLLLSQIPRIRCIASLTSISSSLHPLCITLLLLPNIRNLSRVGVAPGAYGMSRRKRWPVSGWVGMLWNIALRIVVVRKRCYCRSKRWRRVLHWENKWSSGSIGEMWNKLFCGRVCIGCCRDWRLVIETTSSTADAKTFIASKSTQECQNLKPISSKPRESHTGSACALIVAALLLSPYHSSYPPFFGGDGAVGALP